jgi:hypothetical protein
MVMMLPFVRIMSDCILIPASCLLLMKMIRMMLNNCSLTKCLGRN